jgi:hypothetical protein
MMEHGKRRVYLRECRLASLFYRKQLLAMLLKL